MQDKHTINITKLNEMYIAYTFTPEAKYALLIDGRIYLTGHLLNKMALSKEYIKCTLDKNNIPCFYFDMNVREFLFAFRSKDDAVKAVDLFTPNLLLAQLKESQ